MMMMYHIKRDCCFEHLQGQMTFWKMDFFCYQVKYLMIITGPTSETLPLKRPKGTE